MIVHQEQKLFGSSVTTLAETKTREQWVGISIETEGGKYTAAGEKRLAGQKGDTRQVHKGNMVTRGCSHDVAAPKMYRTITQRGMMDGAIASLGSSHQSWPGSLSQATTITSTHTGHHACNWKKRYKLASVRMAQRRSTSCVSAAAAVRNCSGGETSTTGRHSYLSLKHRLGGPVPNSDLSGSRRGR